MPRSALTGSRLRERRMALGLRQGDLAEKVGISASYLNLIEHNRRRIADNLLGRLAEALGVPQASLSEGHAEGLIDALAAAAAEMPGLAAEIDRVEDMARRFPGWSATIVELHGRTRTLARAVEVLNDRIAHDPHLSASLHEVLNAVASVRSTSAILADTEDIDPEWRKRFHANLHADSERLALGAEALVTFLDAGGDGQDQAGVSPQEEVEAWAEALEWDLPDNLGSVSPEHLASEAARNLARELMGRLEKDRLSIPDLPLEDCLAAHGPDPLALARRFNVPVLLAFRRIALRKGSGIGLLICDGSGTLTLRKKITGFSPPRFGAACPLWPLFTALSRAETPVEAVMTLPGPQGARLRARAYCQINHPSGFRGPELREAAMLLMQAPDSSETPIEVGPTCRICLRPKCPARREPSILSS